MVMRQPQISNVVVDEGGNDVAGEVGDGGLVEEVAEGAVVEEAGDDGQAVIQTVTTP